MGGLVRESVRRPNHEEFQALVAVACESVSELEDAGVLGIISKAQDPDELGARRYLHFRQTGEVLRSG